MNKLVISPEDETRLDTLPDAPGAELFRLLGNRALGTLPDCDFNMVICPAWLEESCADGKREPTRYVGALLMAAKYGVVLNGLTTSLGDFVTHPEQRDAYIQGFVQRFEQHQVPVQRMMNANMRADAIRNN